MHAFAVLTIALAALAGCAQSPPSPVSANAPPPPALVPPPVPEHDAAQGALAPAAAAGSARGVALNNEGLALARQGKFAQALPRYRAALALLPASAQAAERAATLNNYGVALASVNELASARAAFTEALALRSAALGALAPASLLSRHNLAVVLGRLGQVQAACEQARIAWRGRVQVLGPAHADTIASQQSVRALPGCPLS